MIGLPLFLIFINDVSSIGRHYGTDVIKCISIRSNIRLFADDTSLSKIVECPLIAAVELTFNLQTIFAWAKQWLVDFNATKTESLIISKKRIKPDHSTLTMGNSNIQEVKDHKQIGIIFSHYENMPIEIY